MSQEKSLNRDVVVKNSEAKLLLDDVYKRIPSVLQPEEYIRFLNLVSSFHWYACSNILLIYFKVPEARFIAEYRIWEETSGATYNEPNRKILKNSARKNPILLVAPYTIVNQATKDRKLVPVSVPVYDVQQVNDIPIPENDFLDPKKYSVEDLANAINFVSPYRICYAGSDDKYLSYNVKGYCNHAQKQFIVDNMLPPRSLLYVLFHEFAEAEVYLANYQDEALQRLVIESIYYVLVKHFELSTDDITFSYVGRFRNISNRDLARALHMIQSIAHSIIERVEEQLEYLVELLPVNDAYQTCFDDIEIMRGFDF